jgi:hypothetical protein
MSNKLANSTRSATKQLERARRQAILMQILNGSKKDLTFEQIASNMRENIWIAQRWPSYSASTANKDFNDVMGLVRGDVGEMAMPYFVKQVALIDDAITTLNEFANDDELDYKLRIDSLNSMRGFLDQSLKIFGNYAPKEMHIQKAEVTFNLDAYNAVKEQLEKQLSVNDIIDGEILKENNDDVDEIQHEGE